MNIQADSPLRVGIAGLGRSGWDIHAAALAGMDQQYQIVAASDPAESRRAEAVQRFGCRVYAQTEELIADSAVELLIVATPSTLHAEHAAAALRAGHHVVCEKPMALSVREADALIRAAADARRILAPFQNLRYSPEFLKLREVIDSGVLGRIVQIRMCRHSFARRWDWQTLRELGGGELNNTGPHAIDQALVLFGPAEPAIFYHSDRALTLGDAEDHFTMMLQAPGQPLIQIEISRACAYPQDTWLVMGDAGALKGTAAELTWRYVDFSTMPVRQVQRERTTDRSYDNEALQWTEQKWSLSDQPSTRTPVTHFYDDLYQTLRHGAALLVTPESVRRQLSVIERCRELEQQQPEQASAPPIEPDVVRPTRRRAPAVSPKVGLAHA